MVCPCYFQQTKNKNVFSSPSLVCQGGTLQGQDLSDDGMDASSIATATARSFSSQASCFSSAKKQKLSVRDDGTLPSDYAAFKPVHFEVMKAQLTKSYQSVRRSASASNSIAKKVEDKTEKAASSKLAPKSAQLLTAQKKVVTKMVACCIPQV